MVPGGLEVISYTTRLIPRTLFIIRLAVLKKPPNPLKRLVGAQGLEPWTRYLKGSGYAL